MEEALTNGCEVILVTASFKELVALIMSDYKGITILAESLDEQLLSNINGEQKVEVLKEFLRDSEPRIFRAFGNTKGDIPML